MTFKELIESNKYEVEIIYKPKEDWMCRVEKVYKSLRVKSKTPTKVFGKGKTSREAIGNAIKLL